MTRQPSTPQSPEPRTPTGKADHDLAWNSDNREAEKAVGNHQWEKVGCAACATITAIETEAAGADALQRVRKSPEPRTIRGTVTREGAVAAWCSTHNDLAWLYEDGSVGCYYDAVTESSNEHDAAPLAIEAEAAEPAGSLDVDVLAEVFDRLGVTSYLPEALPASRLDPVFAITTEYNDIAAEYARLLRGKRDE